MKNIWPHRDTYVAEEKNIWTAFTNDYEYHSLILHSQTKNDSAVRDLEPYQWIFHMQYIKIHLFTLHSEWIFCLRMIGHLENNGSLSYADQMLTQFII